MDSNTDEDDKLVPSDPRNTMRESSPKHIIPCHKIMSETADNLKHVDNLKPSQSNSTSSSSQQQSTPVSYPASDFTYLKKTKKTHTKGCLQKILRSQEEGPKKRRTRLSEEKSAINKVLHWWSINEKVQSLSEVGDFMDSGKPEEKIKNHTQQQSLFIIEDSLEYENVGSKTSTSVRKFPEAHKKNQIRDPQLGKKCLAQKSPDVIVISDNESPLHRVPSRSDDESSYTLPSRKLSAFTSVSTSTQIAIFKPSNAPDSSKRDSIYISGSREGSSEGYNKDNPKKRKCRTPKLTLTETITKGLISYWYQKEKGTKFTIKYEHNKGREVYLAIPLLKKYSFVLEYEGDFISEDEAASREQIYEHNNEGCYIMSFVYKGCKMAIDATRHFESYSRLLNHSRQPNIKFYKPIVVDLENLQPRIGAYALRDIQMGEELVFDYGVRNGKIPWLTNKKAEFYSLMDSNTDEDDEIVMSDPRNTMRESWLAHHWLPSEDIKVTRTLMRMMI